MRIRLFYILGVLGLVACQAGTANQATPAATDPGMLRLPVIGVSPRGDTYRLRNATFDVSGCPDSNPMFPGGYAGVGGAVASQCVNLSLSTESAPDAATSITQRVLPGYYSVSLRTGWRLEQLAGMTWQPVDQVLLLSPAVQNVYVWDHSYTELRYSFGVDGQLIDFQYGDITITIDVRRPEESGGVAGYAGFGSAGSGGSYYPGNIAGTEAVPTGDAGSLALPQAGSK
jgi:hypothetical protein